MILLLLLTYSARGQTKSSYVRVDCGCVVWPLCPRLPAVILSLWLPKQPRVDKVIAGWVSWFYCSCVAQIKYSINDHTQEKVLVCGDSINLTVDKVITDSIVVVPPSFSNVHRRGWPVSRSCNLPVVILLLWLLEHCKWIKSSFPPLSQCHCGW